jgi:RNA polymerase sigma factor (sigma-70 family)
MNSNIIFSIFIVFAWNVLSNAYLTYPQKYLIQRIIQNPETPAEIINKTKGIIALNYIPWTFSQYNQFVNKNRSFLHKKHIPLNDLRQYAVLGMIKALNRYNGSVDFPIYAEKYVLGSLHRGVTDLIPMRPISHTLRMNRKEAPPITFAHENTWMFDKLYKPKEKDSNKILRMEEKYISQKDEIERINNIVKQQSPYEQRMFYYRYSEDTLKEIRTIGMVSKLMCCSDETYRKKMNEIMRKIREKIEVSKYHEM